jgi:hypothetical protein
VERIFDENQQWRLIWFYLDLGPDIVAIVAIIEEFKLMGCSSR